MFAAKTPPKSDARLSPLALSHLPVSAIIITTDGQNEFTVHIGERYSDKMAWEEMLGQVAELTHPDIDRGRFRMLTADEWAAEYVTVGDLNQELDTTEVVSVVGAEGGGTGDLTGAQGMRVGTGGGGPRGESMIEAMIKRWKAPHHD